MGSGVYLCSTYKVICHHFTILQVAFGRFSISLCIIDRCCSPTLVINFCFEISTSTLYLPIFTSSTSAWSSDLTEWLSECSREENSVKVRYSCLWRDRILKLVPCYQSDFQGLLQHPRDLHFKRNCSFLQASFKSSCYDTFAMDPSQSTSLSSQLHKLDPATRQELERFIEQENSKAAFQQSNPLKTNFANQSYSQTCGHVVCVWYWTNDQGASRSASETSLAATSLNGARRLVSQIAWTDFSIRIFTLSRGIYIH